jgi:hypothetical protein
MVKFGKSNVVVDTQFYQSPVVRKRRVKHMIDTGSRVVLGFEEGVVVRSRRVEDVGKRARKAHAMDPGAKVSLGFFLFHDPIVVPSEDYNTTIYIGAGFIDPTGGDGLSILSWCETLWAPDEERGET